uniref:Uncharacterized protein n=1 Tax=Glossina palpalis gambiensis TaxID=67801 RepID=A0A1B0BZ64_9MUSC
MIVIAIYDAMRFIPHFICTTFCPILPYHTTSYMSVLTHNNPTACLMPIGTANQFYNKDHAEHLICFFHHRVNNIRKLNTEIIKENSAKKLTISVPFDELKDPYRIAGKRMLDRLEQLTIASLHTRS